MVSRLFFDLGPVLGQLCALLDGQAEQVDEACCISLIVVLVLTEGSGLLVVQGVRRGDAGVDHVALVELELHIAGDGLFQTVGKGIQSLAQRGEPLAVVNDIGILLGQLSLEVRALLIQSDRLQNIDGLVQDGTCLLYTSPSPRDS